jgi:hypothetical protein
MTAPIPGSASDTAKAQGTPRGCDRRRAMDRRLAQRNLTAGLLAAGLGLLLFGLSFFIAVIYIS